MNGDQLVDYKIKWVGWDQHWEGWQEQKYKFTLHTALWFQVKCLIVGHQGKAAPKLPTKRNGRVNVEAHFLKGDENATK